MKNTIIFRQAIRQAMIAAGATFHHSYTDKVRTKVGHIQAPNGFYWAHPAAGPRRVCFYQVRTPKAMQAQLIQDVTEAGGYLTGVWSRLDEDYVYCNIRGIVQPD